MLCRSIPYLLIEWTIRAMMWHMMPERKIGSLKAMPWQHGDTMAISMRMNSVTGDWTAEWQWSLSLLLPGDSEENSLISSPYRKNTNWHPPFSLALTEIKISHFTVGRERMQPIAIYLIGLLWKVTHLGIRGCCQMRWLGSNVYFDIIWQGC